MENENVTVVGIDVGGSTTKIGGFQVAGGERRMIPPLFVQATDPVTSIYGALGRFTFENQLELDRIDKVMVTGGGSTHISKPLYNLKCQRVPEFDCIGLGGLYLSGLDEAIVASLGTGTALIHAKKKGSETEINYLGGTGVGGGTLLGLTRLLTGVDTVEHIEQICEDGNLDNIDLKIKDISPAHDYNGINQDLTVSNFGRVSDMASQSDIALGVANMVAETIAMVSVFAARGKNVKNIVLTGNLSNIKAIRDTFEGLGDKFGVNFIVPENARFGTVIGAALKGI